MDLNRHNIICSFKNLLIFWVKKGPDFLSICILYKQLFFASALLSINWADLELIYLASFGDLGVWQELNMEPLKCFGPKISYLKRFMPSYAQLALSP